MEIFMVQGLFKNLQRSKTSIKLMTRQKAVVILFTFFFSLYGLKAQTNNTLSSFFENFNTKLIGQKKDSVNHVDPQSLFYLEHIRDSLLKRFINSLNDSTCDLNLNDTAWFAVAKCLVKEDNNPYEVQLALKVAGNPNQGYKWEIISANGELLRFPINKNKKLSSISNETQFQELFQKLKYGEKEIFSYSQKDYDPRLAIFMYKIQQGELEIVNIISTTYHFLQIPDWIFTVRLFEEAPYFGYRISSLKLANKIEKKTYMETITGQR